MQISVE